MYILEVWNSVSSALSIASLLGVPPLAILVAWYRRALNRQIEFSPALAYAHTYFENFVRPLHGSLAGGGLTLAGGVRIDRVFIYMPQGLVNVSEDALTRIKALPGVHEETVVTARGHRTLLVRDAGGDILAFDIPRISSSLQWVIAEHLGKSRESGGGKWRRVEAREFQTFCKHLRRLISNQGYGQQIKVFGCDVADLNAATDDMAAVRETVWRRAWNRIRRGFRASA